MQFPDVPISWGCNSLTKNVVWFEDFLRGYGDATPAYINSQDWMVKRYNSGLEKGQILIGSNVLVSKKNICDFKLKNQNQGSKSPPDH